MDMERKLMNIFPYVSLFVMLKISGEAFGTSIGIIVLLLFVNKGLQKVKKVGEFLDNLQEYGDVTWIPFDIFVIVEWVVYKEIFSSIVDTIGQSLLKISVLGKFLLIIWVIIILEIMMYLPYVINLWCVGGSFVKVKPVTPKNTNTRLEEEKSSKELDEKRKVELEKIKNKEQEEKLKKFKEEQEIKIRQAYDEYTTKFEEYKENIQKMKEITSCLSKSNLLLKEMLGQTELVSNEQRMNILNAYSVKYEEFKNRLEHLKYKIGYGISDDIENQYIVICMYEMGILENNENNRFRAWWECLSENPRKPYKIPYSVKEVQNMVKEDEEKLKKEKEYFSSIYWSILDELKKDYIVTKKGYDGEQIVNAEIEAYSKSFYHLKNIVVSYNNEICEIDQLIISPQGVFVIEVKNIESSGKVKIEIDNTGVWRRYAEKQSQDKGNNILGSDPKEQSNRNRRIIENILNDILGRHSMDNRMEVKSIIVIANNTANIDNQSSQIVLRPNGIVDEIRKHEKCLKQEDMDMIKDSFEERKLPSLKFSVLKYEEIYNVLKGTVETLDEKWNS